MKIIVSLLIVYSFVQTAFGQEMRYLVRSPKGLLMGDAFTAVTDDEYTLYYNPAAIGKNGIIEINGINPDFAAGVGDFGPSDFMGGTPDELKDFPKSPSGITQRIVGKPLYFHGGITPAIKFGPIAFSAFVNSSSSIVLRNAIHPTMSIDYRLDRGFIMGYAYSFGSGAKKDKANPWKKKRKNEQSSSGYRTSLGASVKRIKREGFAEKFPVFGSSLLKTIEADGGDIRTLRDALGFSKGEAWGVDVGAEQIFSTGDSELTFSAAITDVGGTDFKVTSGTRKVPEQQMFVSTAAAWEQNFGLLDYSLSVEVRPWNQPISFGRKIRLGMQLGLPLVRFFGGYSEGYMSYGASLELWPITLSVGFYGAETGSEFKQEESRRAVIYLSLFDFSFDV